MNALPRHTPSSVRELKHRQSHPRRRSCRRIAALKGVPRGQLTLGAVVAALWLPGTSGYQRDRYRHIFIYLARGRAADPWHSDIKPPLAQHPAWLGGDAQGDRARHAQLREVRQARRRGCVDRSPKPLDGESARRAWNRTGRRRGARYRWRRRSTDGRQSTAPNQKACAEQRGAPQPRPWIGVVHTATHGCWHITGSRVRGPTVECSLPM